MGAILIVPSNKRRQLTVWPVAALAGSKNEAQTPGADLTLSLTFGQGRTRPPPAADTQNARWR